MTKSSPTAIVKQGRPFAIKSPESVERLSAQYFKDCDDSGVIYTMNGLAMAFDVDRATLWDYAYGADTDRKVIRPHAVVRSVKRAVQIVSKAWEQLLAGRTPVGAIFWLKNHGWADKVEQDITSKGMQLAPNVMMFGATDPLKRRIERPTITTGSVPIDSDDVATS